MSDARALLREWAETVVVTAAGVGVVVGLIRLFARRAIDAWIVGALAREPELFKRASGQVWQPDITRWEDGVSVAKQTHARVERIESAVDRLAERDEEFTELRADVQQLKHESRAQMQLLRHISDTVAATRESVARIQGAIDPPRPRRRP